MENKIWTKTYPYLNSQCYVRFNVKELVITLGFKASELCQSSEIVLDFSWYKEAFTECVGMRLRDGANKPWSICKGRCPRRGRPNRIKPCFAERERLGPDLILVLIIITAGARRNCVSSGHGHCLRWRGVIIVKMTRHTGRGRPGWNGENSAISHTQQS